MRSGFFAALHDCWIDSKVTAWNQFFRPEMTGRGTRYCRVQGAKYMGSFRPQGGSFQSEDIAVLQKVFDDVWSTIVTHRPTQAENDDLKTMVSEKLCAVAASGVMDPEQLRSRTLASFELSRPPE
jgi:hypothetical protein